MRKLDSHSATPLYRQLYDELKEAIEAGVYKSGEQIPAEDKLREMYGISRITVRKALGQLTEDKILVKRHGKGTFVAETVYVETFGAGGSFTKFCLMMNMKPSTRIIGIQYGKGPQQTEELLSSKPGEKIVTIERLRCVDTVPVILECDYFSEKFQFLCGMDLENQSLHQVLKAQGAGDIYSFQDVYDVYPADEHQAELLSCEKNHPLLRVCQKVYGTEGRIIYYNEQYILSEKYKYASKYPAIVNHK